MTQIDIDSKAGIPRVVSKLDDSSLRHAVYLKMLSY